MGATATGSAGHHGGNSNRRGNHGGSRNAGCIHRSRGIGRADRGWSGTRRLADDSLGSSSRCSTCFGGRWIACGRRRARRAGPQAPATVGTTRKADFPRRCIRMRREKLIPYLLSVAAIACAPAAREPDVPTQATRSYFMGFSIIPPKPDLNVAIKSAEIWTKRADAAIMHLDVPWTLLLAGTSPEDVLRKDGIDLEHHYRGT